MRMAALASGVLVSLAACSSDHASGAAPVVQVNPAFAGSWAGQAQLDLGSYLLAVATGEITVTVANDKATIAGVICSGHYEQVVEAHATGDGNTIEWQGTLDCPEVLPVSQTCSIALGYTRITATLSATDGLSVHGDGWASGCGVPGAMTMVFPFPSGP